MGEQTFLARILGPGRINIIVSLVLLAILVGNAAAICVSRYPEFDGAMNFQVAKNIIEGKGYATTYQGVKANIQTGPTLIVPTALFFKFFGISKFSSQLTNLLYFLAFVGVLVHFCRSYFRIPASFVLVAIVALPEIFQFSLFGYGEVIAAFFTLAGVCLLPSALRRPKWYSFLVGCVLGLAAVTKALSFFSLGVLLIVAICLVRALNKEITLKSLLVSWIWIMTGFFVIPALFELYRLSSLGPSEYVAEVAQISSSIKTKQGFGGTQLTHDLVSNFSEGAEVLSNEFGTPAPLLYMELAAITVLGVWSGKKVVGWEGKLVLYSLIIYFVLGMFWWHFLTAQQWWRRIFLFYLIFLPVISIVLRDVAVGLREFILNRRAKPPFEWIGFAVVIILLLFPTSVTSYYNAVWNIDQTVADPDAADSQVDSVLSRMAVLSPNSTFLVDEWWQGPIVALFSGRGEHFYDYRSHARVFKAYRLKSPVFFLLTYQEKKFDPKSYANLYDQLKEEIVFRTNDYALVNISPLTYYKLMSGQIPSNEICQLIQEHINADNNPTTIKAWSRMLDFSKGGFQDQLCDSWFSLEQGAGGGFRWMGRTGSAFLPLGTEFKPKHLVIELFPVLDQVLGNSQHLKIFFDNHRIFQAKISENKQPKTYRISLGDSLSLDEKVACVSLEIENTISPTDQDVRELGIIISKIGLE